MNHAVSSSKSKASYRKISDREWARHGRRLEQIAAKRGVRAALDHYIENRLDWISQDTAVLSRDTDRAVKAAFKQAIDAIAARVALAHGVTKKAVWSTTTRESRACFARREIWFRAHVSGFTDEQIADFWGCAERTVSEARRLSLQQFPEQAANIEAQAMAHAAEIKKREAAEAKAREKRWAAEDAARKAAV